MSNWVRLKGWRINDGPEHIHLGGGKETAFKLLDETADDGIAKYGLDYDNDEMDPAWQDTWFVQRGQRELPWNTDPLKEWIDGLPEEDAAKQRAAYADGIAAWLALTTTDILRLEGEIEVAIKAGTKKEAITLFLAEKATLVHGKPRDLLIVVSRERFDWSAAVDGEAQQDGTGHARER
jgi:hypothetical protein